MATEPAYPITIPGVPGVSNQQWNITISETVGVYAVTNPPQTPTGKFLKGCSAAGNYNPYTSDFTVQVNCDGGIVNVPFVDCTVGPVLGGNEIFCPPNAQNQPNLNQLVGNATGKSFLQVGSGEYDPVMARADVFNWIFAIMSVIAIVLIIIALSNTTNATDRKWGVASLVVWTILLICVLFFPIGSR